MNYAMVLKNRVIDVLLDQEKEPYYPPDPEGNNVLAIPCVDTIAIGMLYDPETGEFMEDVSLQPQPEPRSMELLMQAQADAELRDFAIQQGQEMLAQQMADIELAMLGGNVI
ncbi:hypothetical protein [Anaerotignum sp. MB30-C6]|uniref:hypothetical protein n=1 Tax=Anaerotignum sp. MB30-C6 TaxID=3070814 RepID=UPI0027DE2897|nr:hypothetical protein [Anaerotignum sp. MB30-C6]WMI82039.1 hypothetical protein RBQ60_04720 [Anaerotignum sp. MB30-C6]